MVGLFIGYMIFFNLKKLKNECFFIKIKKSTPGVADRCRYVDCVQAFARRISCCFFRMNMISIPATVQTAGNLLPSLRPSSLFFCFSNSHIDTYRCTRIGAEK